jgi:hypothetical protein
MDWGDSVGKGVLGSLFLFTKLIYFNSKVVYNELSVKGYMYEKSTFWFIVY